jgi:hypothetical protein
MRILDGWLHAGNRHLVYANSSSACDGNQGRAIAVGEDELAHAHYPGHYRCASSA